MLLAVGCHEASTTDLVRDTISDPEICNIDVGVVFSNRSSYFCLPLKRFKISGPEEVDSITSSCECVKVSLVSYSESSNTNAFGMLCELIADEPAGRKATQPAQLAVELKLITPMPNFSLTFH